MERVDLRQKAEGEWEQLWPPIFLEKAVAALRIRLSDLRARPRKKDSAWDRVWQRQRDQLADEELVHVERCTSQHVNTIIRFPGGENATERSRRDGQKKIVNFIAGERIVLHQRGPMD